MTANESLKSGSCIYQLKPRRFPHSRLRCGCVGNFCGVEGMVSQDFTCKFIKVGGLGGDLTCAYFPHGNFLHVITGILMDCSTVLCSFII